MNTISDYALVLLGAYVVIVYQMVGITVEWWVPLVWVIMWAFIEILIRALRRHRKRRRDAHAGVTR